jgi:hypothetical protein
MKTILLAALLCLSFANSGCVAIIASRQRAALPPGHVGEAKVVVNIPALGGGSLHVKDAIKLPDGSIGFSEYHSEIQTGYGMVKVDILDGQLDATKKAKK